MGGGTTGVGGASVSSEGGCDSPLSAATGGRSQSQIQVAVAEAVAAAGPSGMGKKYWVEEPSEGVYLWLQVRLAGGGGGGMTNSGTQRCMTNSGMQGCMTNSGTQGCMTNSGMQGCMTNSHLSSAAGSWLAETPVHSTAP